MFRSILVVSSLFFCSLIAGCGGWGGAAAESNSSALVDSVIAHQEAFVAALESVNDVDSAKRAKPVMEEAYDDMVSATKELEEFNGKAIISGSLSEDALRKLDEKIRSNMQESGSRISELIDGIQDNPEIMAVLKPVFDKVNEGPIR